MTDAFLVHLASNLQTLEYLYIIGCPRVTHLGIGAVASANKSGLVGISVEGLSQAFVRDPRKCLTCWPQSYVW